MDVTAYLDRINYRGSLVPSAETLRALQVAHLLAVPFENLSIHAGEPVVLEDDALFGKIVNRKRGGFCYELNGLFAALLRTLGFKVEMLNAQVANSEGVFGPDFDHMALMVSLEERWLADVGFGDSFREPLLLDQREPTVQGERIYLITSEGAKLKLLQRAGEGEWKALYRFTLRSYSYADYAGMCKFHQTSPDSHFTRARLCSRATPDGRITISGMRLITDTDGGRKETVIENEEEYARLLREHFGIG